jgi:hypothetical protein
MTVLLPNSQGQAWPVPFLYRLVPVCLTTIPAMASATPATTPIRLRS